MKGILFWLRFNIWNKIVDEHWVHALYIYSRQMKTIGQTMKQTHIIIILSRWKSFHHNKYQFRFKLNYDMENFNFVVRVVIWAVRHAKNFELMPLLVDSSAHATRHRHSVSHSRRVEADETDAAKHIKFDGSSGKWRKIAPIPTGDAVILRLMAENRENRRWEIQYFQYYFRFGIGSIHAVLLPRMMQNMRGGIFSIGRRVATITRGINCQITLLLSFPASWSLAYIHHHDSSLDFGHKCDCQIRLYKVISLILSFFFLLQSYVVQTGVSPSSEPIERSFFIKTKLSSNGGGAEKSAKRIASCRQNANQIEHSEGDGRRHAIAAKQQHAEMPGQPEQKKTLMDENDDVIVWWWRSTVFFFFTSSIHRVLFRRLQTQAGCTSTILRRGALQIARRMRFIYHSEHTHTNTPNISDIASHTQKATTQAKRVFPRKAEEYT